MSSEQRHLYVFMLLNSELVLTGITHTTSMRKREE